MKKNLQNNTPNFFKEHKDMLVAGGAIVVLAGAGFAWYYFKKKKSNKEKEVENTVVIPSKSFVPTSPKKSITRTRKVKSGYPLQFGSRHQDVRILQRYLKIYKEDLGKTGQKRDGVDGIFGSKTLRAAKKRLGKSVFTPKDIEGMRKALNITLN